MAVFGSFALLIALALAAYNLLAGTLALRLQGKKRPTAVSHERLAETARRAGIAGFFAVTAAVFALVWSVFANDFSIAYIMEHSNRALPAVYKFSALWAGQEGSLLLWAWLLAAFGLAPRLTRKRDTRLYACAGAILAGIQVFFLAVLNFAAPPFALLPDYVPGGAIPADGYGMNPLLQYPEMVIHPPLLYLGYVGFAVPFAFALGALMMRSPGERWIRITRVWTMASWLFLTAGVFLGMHWAYAVLGWGGYWSWDPVENSSLMPWLTGTAFLHSVMMPERKGMMKSWNVWLIFATFLLTLVGTMLTRGGLVSSVHAFAASPIGYWFMAFIVIVLAVCIFTYILQCGRMKSEQRVESLVSRESSFLFGNLVLLTACLVILWGTLYPILSEFIEGARVTVDAAWYNRVAVPIGLFLLFLAGAGPLLPWRATSFKFIRRNFALPGIALAVTVVACLMAGVRPWHDGALHRGSFYALTAFALSAGVLTAIGSEFLRGILAIAKQSGRNLAWAKLQLIRSNPRRYGGYTVHIGVVLVVIGLAGAAFNRGVESEMALGGRISIGPYTLENVGATQDTNANYDSDYAVLNVAKGGKVLFQMTPEKRFYHLGEDDQPQTMAAIHSVPIWDLYVVYEGANPGTGQPVIKAFLNPLVSWIWAGALVMLLGALMALMPRQGTGTRSLTA